VLGGFTPGIDETRARRTGAWFWVRVPLLTALAVAGVFAGIFSSVVMFSGGSQEHWLESIGISLVAGGAFGFVAFFRFGGFQGVQHFVLRQLLAQSGRFPRRARPLLEEAVRLNLLQKVGSGYRFIHALLLDHFAGADAGDSSNRAAS